MCKKLFKINEIRDNQSIYVFPFVLRVAVFGRDALQALQAAFGAVSCPLLACKYLAACRAC